MMTQYDEKNVKRELVNEIQKENIRLAITIYYTITCAMCMQINIVCAA